MNKYQEALNDLYGYLADDMVEAPFLFRSCLDTLKELIDKEGKQFNAGFNEATKICSEKIITLEDALDKACECLEEGYGEELASYEYYPNIDTMVEIPYHMNFNEWKAWCLKDE